MIRELFSAIKEYILEYISHRLFMISAIITVLFLILFGRLFKLQIIEGEDHLKNFTYKAKKTITVEAARGNIYDRNGKLLAYNQLAYSVTFENSMHLTEVAKENGISENELKNKIVYRTIQILEENGDELNVNFPITIDKKGKFSFTTSSDAEKQNFLADVYGVSVDKLTETQKNSSAEKIFKFLASDKRFDISESYEPEYRLMIMKARYALWLNRFQQYISVTIARDISDNSVAKLNENSAELMGINVVTDSIRVYNDSKYFAHIIGYIGSISNEEMEKNNKNLSEKNQYGNNDMIGKTGLEQKYESTLRGKNGIEEIYVDNLGKIIEQTKEEDSEAGQDIYLTIDTDLQKYCYDSLEKELAAVLLANMTDEEMDEDEDNPGKLIPITKVYYALFDNNTLDITHLSDKNAGNYEHSLNDTLINTKKEVLSSVRRILVSENTAMSSLDSEYTSYMNYIYSMLISNGVYNNKAIDSTDETYKEYVAGDISLATFMQYAINQEGAIDISSFNLESDYYNSDEVYKALVDYIEQNLSDDIEFDKLIMKYLIIGGRVRGDQIIHILYEQGVLDAENDKDYADFKNSTTDAYHFMRNKIYKLQITPAMLALDPCEGSVVVTDPNNGEILAMVSYPSYDNNRLTNSVESDYYAKLINDKTKPLYNRATQQRTAPGSTYKLLTTIAGVEEGAIDLDTVIEDEGIFKKADPPPKCWIYPGNHGTVDIEEAIEVSCNYFFYQVGFELGGGDDHFSDADGLKKLSKYAKMFGLDTNSGIELSEIDPKVSDESVVRSAIGQGTNSYTPTQLSRYVSTVANSGTCYDLSIISQIKNLNGKVTYENKHNVHGELDIPTPLWNKVHNGMRRVVSEHTDKEMIINQINVDVAGKTGTAEEIESRPSHALFVSYAPFNNPKISVTTVIPFGYSSGNAEELAGFIYAYYFDKEKLSEYSVSGNSSLSD